MSVKEKYTKHEAQADSLFSRLVASPYTLIFVAVVIAVMAVAAVVAF